MAVDRMVEDGPPDGAPILPSLPFFLLGGLFAWHTSWLEQTHVGASGSFFAWTPPERVLIAGRAVWFYALKLVWPANLSFMYARWQIQSGSWRDWLIAVSAFSVPAAIAIGSGRRRGLLVAVLYFGGTLVPALGFFNLFPFRYSFVADHFQYLASLGILTLIAAWCFEPRVSDDPKRRRRALAADNCHSLPHRRRHRRVARPGDPDLAATKRVYGSRSRVVGRARKEPGQHGCQYPVGAPGESEGRL